MAVSKFCHLFCWLLPVWYLSVTSASYVVFFKPVDLLIIMLFKYGFSPSVGQISLPLTHFPILAPTAFLIQSRLVGRDITPQVQCAREPASVFTRAGQSSQLAETRASSDCSPMTVNTSWQHKHTHMQAYARTHIHAHAHKPSNTHTHERTCTYPSKHRRTVVVVDVECKVGCRAMYFTGWLFQPHTLSKSILTSLFLCACVCLWVCVCACLCGHLSAHEHVHVPSWVWFAAGLFNFLAYTLGESKSHGEVTCCILFRQCMCYVSSRTTALQHKADVASLRFILCYCIVVLLFYFYFFL